MSFFDYSVAPLRRKQTNCKLQVNQKLWCFHWQIGKHRFYSTVYTQLDQACILWALLLMPMFVTAQFSATSWTIQASLCSVFSLFGLAAMVGFSQDWVRVKRVRWVVYCWVILILVGLLFTDLAIFWAWGGVLAHLCSLWLGLSALGYLFTGVAVHSRAIIAIGFVHLLAIWVLPYVSSWQFLFTGTVMVLSLLLLAEFQWDIGPSFMEKL